MARKENDGSIPTITSWALRFLLSSLCFSTTITAWFATRLIDKIEARVGNLEAIAARHDREISHIQGSNSRSVP